MTPAHRARASGAWIGLASQRFGTITVPHSDVSAVAVIRIMSNSADPRIRPGPDRVIGLAVPGAALRADQMVRHLRHRHSLRQVETASLDIEMALRPA